MERLTKRVGYRSEAAPLEDMDDALALQGLIDRLSAYEDTGLMPEEILDPVEMAKAAIAIKENTRLREQLAEVTAEVCIRCPDGEIVDGIKHYPCASCKWRGKETGDANG